MAKRGIDKPWLRRQTLASHRKRVREARVVLDEITQPAYIAERAGDAERAAETQAIADNLLNLLLEIEAINDPKAHTIDAGMALARAVSRLDAVLNAARWMWARGFLYEAASLMGQATAFLMLASQAQQQGKVGGTNETGAKVAAVWRQLESTGEPERSRSATIAQRLEITEAAVRLHVAKLGLRKGKTQNRG